MRIYLSGKMTGLPNFGAEIFAVYAAKYRAKGWEVLSPPELDEAFPLEGSYNDYLLRDVKILFGKSIDRIYMLPNWKDSKGAKLERLVAETIGIPAFDADTEQPIYKTYLEDLS